MPGAFVDGGSRWEWVFQSSEEVGQLGEGLSGAGELREAEMRGREDLTHRRGCMGLLDPHVCLEHVGAAESLGSEWRWEV